MKRLIIITAALVAALSFSSCVKTELAPEFSRSELPAEVPACGGEYLVKVDYLATKSVFHYLEWEFRTVVDGKVISQVNVPACDKGEFLHNDHFTVCIPANLTGHPRTVIVESSWYNEWGRESYDSDGNCYDDGWWTDWEPVCSSVQLAD